MNSKVIIFIKNFSFTLTANIISLLISTLIILIVPKFIGIKEYGYYQVYLFYASYIGFFHFGWISGLYLKLGGKSYDELDKKNISSQFYLLLFMQLIIGFLIVIFVSIFSRDYNKTLIYYMISICLILTNTRDMISFIFQATNRIKEYAMIVTIGRLVYFGTAILFLIIGIKSYRFIILADIIGVLISLIYAIYQGKEIVFNSLRMLNFNIKDALDNINIGSKLMLANVASMLIIGVVRYGIEHSWDIETFGKVSLTLSVSNMMMVFINALGIIIFPMLRRITEKRLSEIYLLIRDFLMVILLSLLVTYYPLRSILAIWLPKYSESLMYMALIFPMFIYEGKMSLLINSYLKTLRKEKLMLITNLIMVCISMLFTVLTTVILKNINMAILSIVVLLAIRSTLSEIILSKILKVNLIKDILLEIILISIFIISSWLLNSWMSTLIYGFTYIIYLLIKRKDIIGSKNIIKSLIKVHEV